MIILALADIHGDASKIPRVFEEVKEADVVLLLGDITHFGREEDAGRIVEPILERAPRLLAVPGNCDYPEVADHLERQKLSIHRRCEVLGGTGFLGVGGSLPCPGRTPNEATEAEFAQALGDAVSAFPCGMPMVLVTHQPPWGTKNDLVSIGRHVGSRSIRGFVEQYQPLICFTGHIHEGVGIDTIGETRVVNPGPLRHGQYAFAEITGGQVKTLEIRNTRA